MKNTNENLDFFITNFDKIFNKIGSLIMFGTLILFFHGKFNFLNKLKLKDVSLKPIMTNQIDVDNRLLDKASCLTTTNDGIEVPKQPSKFKKIRKAIKKTLFYTAGFFAKPILDIIEIWNIIFYFIASRHNSNEDKENKPCEEIFYDQKRKVRSCLALNLTSQTDNIKPKCVETVIIHGDNNENIIYEKSFLPLKKIHHGIEKFSMLTLLTDNLPENYKPLEREISFRSDYGSNLISSKQYNQSLKKCFINSFDMASDVSEKTQNVNNGLKLNEQTIKKRIIIQKDKNNSEILRKKIFKNSNNSLKSDLEKQRRKNVVNITDSLIKNVALNVCSDDSERSLNFMHMANVKTRVYTGKLKLGH
jgi:hypothetical protein